MSALQTIACQPMLLQQLLDGFNGGLIILNKNQQIVFINQWVKDYCPIVKAEFDAIQNQQQAFIEVFPELENSRVHEAIINALENRFPSVISHVLNRHPFPFYHPENMLSIDTSVLSEKVIKDLETQGRIFQSIQVSPFGHDKSESDECYCQIVIHDVTASMLREQALQHQVDEKRHAVDELAQQKKLFESGPSVVFKIHAIDELPIEYVSPNSFEQFYYNYEQLINDKINFTSLIHEDDLRGYWDTIDEKQSHNIDYFEQEYRIIDGRGEERWINDFTTIVRDDKGQVKYFHGYLIDVSEHKHIETQIKQQAYYDSLTSLPNRRMLTERLSEDISRAKRHNFYSALLFMDLDHFKYINDSLGHGVGDALLVEVSKRIKQRIRVEDIAARIGGDEFVIVLSELDSKAENAAVKARFIADNLRDKLSASYHILGNELHTSPSIGVVIYPRLKEDSQKIIQHADTAMYHAKAAGRNGVRFFTEEMQSAADNRLNLEKNLRLAVNNHELCLVYQPQVNQHGKVIACEALVRWVKDDNVVSPADFIPVAEETGIIIDIGEWVLKEACRQFKYWQQQSKIHNTETINYIAVNISPKQFRDANFLNFVETALGQYNMNPSELELEITEGIVIADVEDTVKKMHYLKSLGVRLAMDDFGTGYSSLSYLKKLPLDVLKIDQSFVRDATTDPNDKAIVATIIAMAKHLDLVTVAEGIEDNLILNHLRQEGCSIFQGYYFSRPINGEEFTEFLNSWDGSLIN